MAIKISNTTVINNSRGIENVTSIFETNVSLGAGSTIDLSTGTYFYKAVTGATTFAVSNVPATGKTASFVLELQNAGSYAITWWSGLTWAQGTAPTLTTTGTDILGFYTNNGGNTWRGLVMSKDIK